MKFIEYKMSYKKVILFSIITAFITALILVVPFLNKTSLGNMGVYIESWILFALIIIMNCDKPIEASLKTFIFFLISQPLIYLLQVPFSYLHWQIFMFYPRWFIITLLTLPGAYIAWFVKKDNVLSAIILSVATSLLIIQGFDFLKSSINHFPNNLLSCLFCFGLVIWFNLSLLKNRINKIIAFLIDILAIVFSVFYYFL